MKFFSKKVLSLFLIVGFACVTPTQAQAGFFSTIGTWIMNFWNSDMLLPQNHKDEGGKRPEFKSYDSSDSDSSDADETFFEQEDDGESFKQEADGKSEESKSRQYRSFGVDEDSSEQKNNSSWGWSSLNPFNWHIKQAFINFWNAGVPPQKSTSRDKDSLLDDLTDDEDDLTDDENENKNSDEETSIKKKRPWELKVEPLAKQKKASKTDDESKDEDSDEERSIEKEQPRELKVEPLVKQKKASKTDDESKDEDSGEERLIKNLGPKRKRRRSGFFNKKNKKKKNEKDNEKDEELFDSQDDETITKKELDEKKPCPKCGGKDAKCFIAYGHCALGTKEESDKYGKFLRGLLRDKEFARFKKVWKMHPSFAVHWARRYGFLEEIASGYIEKNQDDRDRDIDLIKFMLKNRFLRSSDFYKLQPTLKDLNLLDYALKALNLLDDAKIKKQKKESSLTHLTKSRPQNPNRRKPSRKKKQEQVCSLCGGKEAACLKDKKCVVSNEDSYFRYVQRLDRAFVFMCDRLMQNFLDAEGFDAEGFEAEGFEAEGFEEFKRLWLKYPCAAVCCAKAKEYITKLGIEGGKSSRLAKHEEHSRLADHEKHSIWSFVIKFMLKNGLELVGNEYEEVQGAIDKLSNGNESKVFNVLDLLNHEGIKKQKKDYELKKKENDKEYPKEKINDIGELIKEKQKNVQLGSEKLPDREIIVRSYVQPKGTAAISVQQHKGRALVDNKKGPLFRGGSSIIIPQKFAEKKHADQEEEARQQKEREEREKEQWRARIQKENKEKEEKERRARIQKEKEEHQKLIQKEKEERQENLKKEKEEQERRARIQKEKEEQEEKQRRARFKKEEEQQLARLKKEEEEEKQRRARFKKEEEQRRVRIQKEERELQIQIEKKLKGSKELEEPNLQKAVKKAVKEEAREEKADDGKDSVLVSGLEDSAITCSACRYQNNSSRKDCYLCLTPLDSIKEKEESEERACCPLCKSFNSLKAKECSSCKSSLNVDNTEGQKEETVEEVIAALNETVPPKEKTEKEEFELGEIIEETPEERGKKIKEHLKNSVFSYWVHKGRLGKVFEYYSGEEDKEHICKAIKDLELWDILASATIFYGKNNNELAKKDNADNRKKMIKLFLSKGSQPTVQAIERAVSSNNFGDFNDLSECKGAIQGFREKRNLQDIERTAKFLSQKEGGAIDFTKRFKKRKEELEVAIKESEKVVGAHKNEITADSDLEQQDSLTCDSCKFKSVPGAVQCAICNQALSTEKLSEQESSEEKDKKKPRKSILKKKSKYPTPAELEDLDDDEEVEEQRQEEKKVRFAEKVQKITHSHAGKEQEGFHAWLKRNHSEVKLPLKNRQEYERLFYQDDGKKYCESKGIVALLAQEEKKKLSEIDDPEREFELKEQAILQECYQECYNELATKIKDQKIEDFKESVRIQAGMLQKKMNGLYAKKKRYTWKDSYIKAYSSDKRRKKKNPGRNYFAKWLVNYQDENGNTLLHHAAQIKDDKIIAMKCIKSLIDLGARADAQNYTEVKTDDGVRGQTPADIAIIDKVKKTLRIIGKLQEKMVKDQMKSYLSSIKRGRRETAEKQEKELQKERDANKKSAEMLVKAAAVKREKEKGESVLDFADKEIEDFELINSSKKEDVNNVNLNKNNYSENNKKDILLAINQCLISAENVDVEDDYMKTWIYLAAVKWHDVELTKALLGLSPGLTRQNVSKRESVSQGVACGIERFLESKDKMTEQGEKTLRQYIEVSELLMVPVELFLPETLWPKLYPQKEVPTWVGLSSKMVDMPLKEAKERTQAKMKNSLQTVMQSGDKKQMRLLVESLQDAQNTELAKKAITMKVKVSGSDTTLQEYVAQHRDTLAVVDLKEQRYMKKSILNLFDGVCTKLGVKKEEHTSNGTSLLEKKEEGLPEELEENSSSQPQAGPGVMVTKAAVAKNISKKEISNLKNIRSKVANAVYQNSINNLQENIKNLSEGSILQLLKMEANEKSHNKKTILEVALQKANPKIVKSLLRCGVPVGHKRDDLLKMVGKGSKGKKRKKKRRGPSQENKKAVCSLLKQAFEMPDFVKGKKKSL